MLQATSHSPLIISVLTSGLNISMKWNMSTFGGSCRKWSTNRMVSSWLTHLMKGLEAHFYTSPAANSEMFPSNNWVTAGYRSLNLPVACLEKGTLYLLALIPHFAIQWGLTTLDTKASPVLTLLETCSIKSERINPWQLGNIICTL